MPIKTNFLKLEKLEGHENYNGDIENSNLDKIDATIKNHEDRTRTLEDKINKKDKLTVELKPEKRVVSVTDSFGGACGFEIEGALVQQLFRNGDFSKWKEDWTSQASKSFEISDGKAIVTADGSYPTCTLTTWGAYKRRTKIGERYFLYAKARVRDDVAKEMYVTMWNGSSLSGDVTKVKPKKDTWIDLYDVFTVGKDGTEFGCYVTSKYDSTAIAKDKILEVDYVMCFKIEDSDKDLTRSELKSKYIKDSYYKGVLPLRGVSIEAVGKNLFDKNRANLKGYYNINDNFVSSRIDSSTDFIAIKENTTYFQNDGTSQYANFYDNNFKFIRNEATNKDGVKGKFESKAGDVYVRLSFRTNQLDTYMVTEGSNRVVNYNSHKSSKIVLDDPLVKLPNGVSDKIVRESGKTVKYANTNVGRDGEFYTVKDSDVTIYTSGNNVNLVRVHRANLKGFANGGFQKKIVNDRSSIEITSNWDSLSSIGSFSTKISPTEIDFIVSKSIVSLEDGKDYIRGTKIAYELEIPQTIDLKDELEPVISQEGYTQFNVEDGVIENEKANLIKIGSNYWFNTTDPNYIKTPSKYMIRKILCIKSNGKDITKLGAVDPNRTLSYGDERWYITEKILKDNNIDENKIYVTYVTSEANGQSNVKIKYNADMSSAVSSNANAINIVGEQTDRNTKEVDRLGKPLEWIEPSLLNGWVNYDNVRPQVAYAKDSLGWIHIKGLIKGGSIGQPAFIFPEKYRIQDVEKSFSVVSNSAFGVFKVDEPNGAATPYIGSNVWFSLDGISFYVGAK
jgi:hypothetical protein